MGRLAFLLVLGACLAKPDRPHCGDGVLESDEVCDDGNFSDGDGCSTTCEIEPWFVCPTTGAACHPILELQWIAPGSTLSGIGGMGGTEYDDDCQQVIGLSARSTVVVGFEGASDANGMSLTGLRAICADVELRDDGGIRWRDPMPTPTRGNNDENNAVMQLCDDDEVATGFIGSADNFVSGFQLACQAITHTGGVLALGAANRLPALGPNNSVPQPAQSCGPLEIVRAVVGRSGGAIDELSLKCVATALLECGDGKVAEPETCDDGNAIDGDGCNATCSGD